ncbi:MAG: DUF429 domain-containing protein [Flammeovirgaceae bacterium]
MSPRFIGIDGCKVGWVVASIFENELSIEIHQHINEVWERYKENVLLIDIPIGLLEDSSVGAARQCDVEARRLLGKKSSSVFPVPCRQAVYLAPPEKRDGWYRQWHKAVNLQNKKVLGKGLPIQSLGIVAKIKEVDELLQKELIAQTQLLEAHPEVAFYQLKGSELDTSKKTQEGENERLQLIKHFCTIWDTSLTGLQEVRFPKSNVNTDDLLDAVCLAIHSKLGQINGFASLGNQQDAKGIPMKISYGNC